MGRGANGAAAWARAGAALRGHSARDRTCRRAAARLPPRKAPAALRRLTQVLARLGLLMCSLRMGGDALPPGPEGRGPFDANDAFVLPDGRVYQPGDGPTDALYGESFCSWLVWGRCQSG